MTNSNDKSAPIYISIVGKIVEIIPLYDYIGEYVKNYRVDVGATKPNTDSGDGATKPNTEIHPDFSISVTQADVEFERKKSAETDINEGRNVLSYPDGYLETLAIYRKIADVMVTKYDTFLFHGSVLEMDGQGFLFTAKSGTGKSTHTRLWRELYGDKVTVVNDDKPLISIEGGKAKAWGTPWDGKHHISKNMSCDLKGICILERGEKNEIEKITGKEAYTMILQQMYRSQDKLVLIKTMSLIDKLMKNVDFYRLKCNMDIDAARISYEGMR